MIKKVAANWSYYMDEDHHSLVAAAWIFALFVFMGLVGAWIAVQTPIALVDDVSNSKFDIFSIQGLRKFVSENFVSEQLMRYRPTWELYQDITWRVFGANLFLHHALMFLLRAFSCAAALVLLNILVRKPHPYASLIVIAYGFFFPNVPESRLGPQEPIFVLSLLLCLIWVCNVLIPYGRALSTVRLRSLAWFVLLFTLLAGSKEVAAPILLLLFLLLVYLQISERRFRPVFTSAIFVVAMIQIWRTSVVFESSSYAQKQAGSGNVVDTLYSAVDLIKDYMLYDVGRLWISATVFVFGTAFLVGLMKIIVQRRYGLNRERLIGWLLILLVLGLMLVMFAKLRPVPRYMYPGVWLVAIILGAGVHYAMRTFGTKSPVNTVAAISIVLIALGNWPAFLWHFAAQKSVRDSEVLALRYVSDIVDVYPERPVYIFGYSPSMMKKGQWDLWQNSEQGVSFHSYFLHFRPKYFGSEPVDLPAIEGLARSDRTEDVWVVSYADAGELHEIYGIKGQFMAEYETRPVLNSLAIEVFDVIHQMLSDLRVASAGYPQSDHGAPKGVGTDIRASWHVYKLSSDLPDK